MKAAGITGAPVLLQLTRSSIDYMGLKQAVSMGRRAIEDNGLTGWIHLDHGGSVSAGWGFVKAKGGYNYTSSNNERTNNKTTKQIGSKITIDGMQIIGYRCHVLGKSPNPLTSITEWI